MATLSTGEFAALKVAVARTQPRFDVGLFGNSRIVMIGREELKIAPLRMFNFAVPGQSIRQSVRMIDQLHKIGKMPATVVIMFDHAQMGVPEGGGVYPSMLERWHWLAAETLRIWQSMGWRASAVEIINAIALERDIQALTFNRTYLGSKLRAMFGETGARSRYRADGSVAEILPVRGSVERVPPPPRADVLPQLEYNLEQLAALKMDKKRIIIYESPLEPSIMKVVERDLSPKARDVRRRLHEACLHYGFECHDAPILADKPVWRDSHHAPAFVLGAWLRKIIGIK